jgi:hypothetical protein
LSRENRTPGSRRLQIQKSLQLGLKDGVFDYILPELKALLTSGKLFIANGEKLKKYMGQIEDSDISELSWGDVPSVEALAFVALEMVRRKNRPAKRYGRVMNDYERL